MDPYPSEIFSQCIDQPLLTEKVTCVVNVLKILAGIMGYQHRKS